MLSVHHANCDAPGRPRLPSRFASGPTALSNQHIDRTGLEQAGFAPSLTPLGDVRTQAHVHVHRHPIKVLRLECFGECLELLLDELEVLLELPCQILPHAALVPSARPY